MAVQTGAAFAERMTTRPMPMLLELRETSTKCTTFAVYHRRGGKPDIPVDNSDV